ncbi:MAG: hypothetical protein WCO42_03930 [bacterium]
MTLPVSALLAAFYYQSWTRIPSLSIEPPPSQPAIAAPTPLGLTGEVWRVMQALSEKSSGNAYGITAPDRFQLRGTFFIEGLGEPQPKAILDDALKHEQFVVAVGDRLDEVKVQAIFHDHVILQTTAGTRDLWVEFASRLQSADTIAVASNQTGGASNGTNKFGCVKVQDNRWQFRRKPLLDYYQELLDEPDRMVAVFDTMKPVRDERNKITGYVVGLEGEKDFFDSIGLQQGDIVRSVNSLAMTNRRRAESFIDQFLKDRLSAVVLEVERGGVVTKQVYQMQP